MSVSVSPANSVLGGLSPSRSPASSLGSAAGPRGPLLRMEEMAAPRGPGSPAAPLGGRSSAQPSHYCSSPEDEEPSMEEDDSQLTEGDVSNGLSSLGSSAAGLEHVYLSLSLPGRNLLDVSILCNYIHLQKLELAHNRIQDLSCVSHMPFLIKLDASHNELRDFFGFEPPKNLKEVNYSHNQMSEMKDLSAYASLSKLILDYNGFSEIKGLENCSSLSHLSLANNRISHISGLDNLPIKELCLRSNRIQKIEKLENLHNLQVLDLSFNGVQSLSGLQNHDLLESINLENNQISEVEEATHIHDLPLLRDLNLLGNPVQEHPDYRLSLLFLLQRLTDLDRQKVRVEEKVAAVNKYDPPPEVVAARDHMTHVVYQQMQPQIIFDSTLPSLDAPYPMLVLTGPQACGKRELAHRLCREFSDFFAYGACHTTRSPYFGEVDGSDYHFVSEEFFENMIRTGKFIQTMKYGGHYYGLARDAIENIAREGLACCVHMELEGVRSLKNTYFEPRYILLIPMDKEEYARRLRMRGLYSRSQIEIAVSRVDTYINMNRDYPGYFDTVIPCDDTLNAYRNLSKLVREYLGLGEKTVRERDRTTMEEDSFRDLGAESPVEEKARDSPTGVTVSNYAYSAEAPEVLDPTSRNYSVKVQAKLSAPKTSAEMASIQRRQQAAREALQGKTPSAYAQLFRRCPITAPASLGPGQHLLDPASYASMLPSTSNVTQNRSFSAASLDSSSEESRASSGLSMLSSAGAFSSEESPVPPTSSKGLDAETEYPVESLDIADLENDSLKDPMDLHGTPNAPRPGSSTERTSVNSVHPTVASPAVTSARPGTNTKPVLPPIPSGRKTSEHQGSDS
ncbi:leucine-rich repeat and guanylate kinase domain-containing protein [Amia ocellicauda]|uniref:leucine-rich repeat and guanylate kinase domain-containing protein n=1 Tax=Amia ocellicauda TaxID=2972642 RepID=UPI003464E18B